MACRQPKSVFSPTPHHIIRLMRALGGCTNRCALMVLTVTMLFVFGKVGHKFGKIGHYCTCANGVQAAQKRVFPYTSPHYSTHACSWRLHQSLRADGINCNGVVCLWKSRT